MVHFDVEAEVVVLVLVGGQLFDVAGLHRVQTLKVRGPNVRHILNVGEVETALYNLYVSDSVARYLWAYRWRRFARVDVISLEAGGEIVARGLPGVVEHVAGVGCDVRDNAALAHRHLLPIAAASDQLKFVFVISVSVWTSNCKHVVHKTKWHQIQFLKITIWH